MVEQFAKYAKTAAKNQQAWKLVFAMAFAQNVPESDNVPYGFVAKNDCPIHGKVGRPSNRKAGS